MVEPALTVRTMLGARGVDLALRCLGSLRDNVERPFTLAIHEDGTLTDAHRDRLAGRLAPCRFVDRGEAGAVAAEKLARHPRCARFRHEHLFGIKLFDLPLLSAAGERVVYCDTDILFNRPLDCPGYFAGSAEASFVAMQDLKESYAVRLRKWPVLRRRGIRLASRICAGMISYDPAAHDLDFIEWLLGVDAETGLFDGFPFWAEQTIYAALAARAGAAWIEPAQCAIAHRATFARARQAAILHFAGFGRGLLDELPACGDRPPVTLGTKPAPECGLGRRLLSAARTRLWYAER